MTKIDTSIFKVEPIFIEKVWGKKIGDKFIGEIILFSASKSLANSLNGKFDLNLYKLFSNSKSRIAFFGDKYKSRSTKPMIVKFIYANDNLSLQVHPKKFGENWYFMNENPSNIYLGFKENVNRFSFVRNVDLNKVNTISVKKGDFVSVKPGMVHSILAGGEVCEIKDECLTTYRVFDWNGRKTSRILSAINMDSNPTDPIKYKSTLTNHQDEYYSVEKKIINEQINIESFSNFKLIIVITGSIDVTSNKQTMQFSEKCCCFIKAKSIVKVSGDATVLIVS